MEKVLKDDYELAVATQLNFLIIGRSSSGKTTFVNNLQKRYGVTKENIQISDTLVAETHHFSVRIAQKYYSISIIDTPGLFEMREKQEQIRSDQQLMQIAIDCVKNNFTQLNGVLVTHSFSDMISPENLKVFEILNKELKAKLRERTVLLVTHSENANDDEREKYKKDLLVPDKFKLIRDLFGDRILFTGGLNHQLLRAYPSLRDDMTAKVHTDNICIMHYLVMMTESCAPIDNIEYLIQARKQTELAIRKSENEVFMANLAKALNEGKAIRLDEKTIIKKHESECVMM